MNPKTETAINGLRHAESMLDAEITIYAAQGYLLGRIAETSSDLVRARKWPEFCDAIGGLAAAENAHAQAVTDWEKWNADSEG